MKRIWIAALALAALAACNSNSSTTESKDDKKTSSTDITGNPDYKAGFELVAKSNCFTCHKVDEAYTGPTYRQIADKYASQAPAVIPSLAEKIIKGGSGVWGQVPMLAHPDVSEADAETMVKYILLLKK